MGALRALLLQVPPEAARAGQPLECARPGGAVNGRERADRWCRGARAPWWVERRFHAHMLANCGRALRQWGREENVAATSRAASSLASFYRISTAARPACVCVWGDRPLQDFCTPSAACLSVIIFTNHYPTSRLGADRDNTGRVGMFAGPSKIFLSLSAIAKLRPPLE